MVEEGTGGRPSSPPAGTLHAAARIQNRIGAIRAVAALLELARQAEDESWPLAPGGNAWFPTLPRPPPGTGPQACGARAPSPPSSARSPSVIPIATPW